MLITNIVNILLLRSLMQINQRKIELTPLFLLYFLDHISVFLTARCRCGVWVFFPIWIRIVKGSTKLNGRQKTMESLNFLWQIRSVLAKPCMCLVCLIVFPLLSFTEDSRMGQEWHCLVMGGKWHCPPAGCSWAVGNWQVDYQASLCSYW